MLASFHKITKQNTIQKRQFFLRDHKKVSISILFRKFSVGWKLSPIINKRGIGTWSYNIGLLYGTSGTKDLCMVPCHSCHIYGIWTSTSKKVWEMLRSHQLGMAMQVTKGGLFS